jgi:hypothetical protein
VPGTVVPADGTESEDDDTLSVLAYNVHGLFALAAADNPRSRMPTIGWLANRYDVVLVQEDFEYHEQLAAQMPGKVGIRGNGVGCDPRRLAVKILLTPFALLIPDFWPPYGAGVSTFVPAELVVPGDVERRPFGICNGWFGESSDCWANKGFLRVAVRGPAGSTLDVYNAHLDSGAGPKSVETRRRQLDVLVRAIEEHGRERALIIGADFNIAYSRPGDRELMTEFRERLGLEDSGAGPELPYWRQRDFVLYRDGASVDLAVERSGEAREFVNEDRALSDHPALYAEFRLEALDAGARTSPR